MSESVIEIDATIDDDTEVKETIVGTESPCLVESSNNKRRLDEDVEHVDGDDDDEETAVRSSRKKFCTENDTRTESEKDVMQFILTIALCDTNLNEFDSFFSEC